MKTNRTQLIVNHYITFDTAKMNVDQNCKTNDCNQNNIDKQNLLILLISGIICTCKTSYRENCIFSTQKWNAVLIFSNSLSLHRLTIYI